MLPLLAVVLLSSCVSLEVAAPPVEKLNLPKGVNRQQLAEGRQILATSCVKCHAPPRIAHHSAQDWDEEILPAMCRKAKLEETQAKLLRNYVLTAHEAMTKPAAP